eukprot:1157215-Pelagomonas_calceolata.AAC.2
MPRTQQSICTQQPEAQEEGTAHRMRAVGPFPLPVVTVRAPPPAVPCGGPAAQCLAQSAANTCVAHVHPRQGTLHAYAQGTLKQAAYPQHPHLQQLVRDLQQQAPIHAVVHELFAVLTKTDVLHPCAHVAHAPRCRVAAHEVAHRLCMPLLARHCRGRAISGGVWPAHSAAVLGRGGCDGCGHEGAMQWLRAVVDTAGVVLAEHGGSERGKAAAARD